jgi:hypothetical protein
MWWENMFHNIFSSPQSFAKHILFGKMDKIRDF